MAQAPTTPTSPDHRPRPRSRGISFRSDKSGGSDSRSKINESPREKAQRDSIWKGGSKANPNAAVTEAQPAVANITEESTLQPLRSVEHRDTSGNVIADPDRSNPTRPRMERPLDTIRSFERAIDDGYRRRTSYLKQDSEQWDRENQFASRRSSYFGGEYMPNVRRKRSANALAGYDNGPSPNRPAQGGGGGGGGYYGNQTYYNNAPPPRRYPGHRMASDPQLYGNRPQAYHNYQQSYDTVNTGVTNGSDSTGPWASGTDPSSENSSIDKVNAMNKPVTPMDPYGGYAQNGHNGTIMEEHAGGMYGNYWHGQQRIQQNDYAVQDDQGYGQTSQNGYPVPPRDIYARSNSTPQLQQYSQPGPGPSKVRKPIPLGASNSGAAGSRAPANLPPQVQEKPEKRQSWLKRTFSRNK